VNLAQKGVWSIVICTQPFKALAELNARALGMPDLDLFVVPVTEPLGGLDADELAAVGREVSEELLRRVDG
jgi:hypothetical protein